MDTVILSNVETLTMSRYCRCDVCLNFAPVSLSEVSRCELRGTFVVLGGVIINEGM